MTPNQIDVIVRFGDITHLTELERCLFSLVGQDYRPLHIILTVPRFSQADIEHTRAALMPLFESEQAPSFEILNREHDAPDDARSTLINFGIRAAKGRYLAFLDADQVLYPEAYRLLIAQLQSGGADIALAGVRRVEMEAFSCFFHSRATLPSPECAGLRDLFRDNVRPIHSYVIDRTRIPELLLFFEPTLTLEASYDFLLRICAEFISDFTLAQTGVGEDYEKVGRSPTLGVIDDGLSEHVRREQEVAFVEQRRRTTSLSKEVQRALGVVSPRTNLSIRNYLDGAA